MDFNRDCNPHLRLTFNESMILMENLSDQNKAAFIVTLVDLARNTSDTLLLQEVRSLNEKVLELSEDEFTALRTAVLNRKVLFPANYPMV